MITGDAGRGEVSGRGATGDLRQARSGVAVDQLGRFINKYGAPVPGVGVDKPREFINTEPMGGETQVVMAMGVVGESELPAAGASDLGEGTLQGGVQEDQGLLRRSAPSPWPSPEGRGEDGRLRLPETSPECAKSSDDGAAVDRGGRPAVITPAIQEQICTLISVGFSRRQAAAYVDIDQSTIHRTAKRNPEFAMQLRRAEEKALLQPMLTVISQAQKNWRAAAWLIRYKGQPTIELTEEEKEEQHQERLADARRRAEEGKAWFEAMRTSTPGSPPVQTVEVKRSSKGKREVITRMVSSSSSGKRKRR